MWFKKKFDYAERQLERFSARITELEDIEKERERQIDELIAEKRKLKEEVAGLELQKKIEQEDIEHMVTMQKEKLELEKERAIMESKQQAQDEIKSIRDECTEKLQGYLEQSIKQGEERYKEILSKLADVTIAADLSPGRRDRD